MFNNLICEKKDNIYIIKIDREKYLNSLNEELLSELDKAIDILKEDEDLYVGIIIGQGRAFVAGADISFMKNMSIEEARKFSKKGSDVFRKIENLDKPIIAAINGFALGGGCELAMSCDIRISSSKAKFSQPEVGLGIIPGFSGTQRLARLVGTGKAKELIYTGDVIKATEAYEINLINKIVEPDELMKEAIIMAEKIASKSQLAIRYSKNAINKGYETDIDTGISLENYLFSLCFSNDNPKEGMNAFLEKRQAKFKI